MDDYLFKVVDGEVEIVKPPFQAVPSEKAKEVFSDGIPVPKFTGETVPPLRSETVPPLKKVNRAFPTEGFV